eukprot:CAMPEP_0204153212 /NCGR_PEP_ID=MMETSP0361-20130328/27672_1 /ASSEMBLY_ACC=CAM_ASM_000343 /TAXON_ID=268821 /ORGANISM="Scrippsiella Hangoei, Strain SHTV-5" /LENGTH=40 /DNA_ID= /DNA_START= /DNA_END= /DNA_ORIENTATION=
MAMDSQCALGEEAGAELIRLHAAEIETKQGQELEQEEAAH